MNINSISKNEIKNYINSYEVPSLPKYDGNREITTAELKTILNNRNLEKVQDQNKPLKGIVVQRSNLRSIPTNTHFYSNRNTKYLDNIQETELLVNTPVLILHTSRDDKWFFVLSPTYYGWVIRENIAYATDSDWNYFINTTEFIIIIDDQLQIDDTVLDMSVKLPYNGFDDKNYRVIMPKKNNNGYVKKFNTHIAKEKANIGYLPYTQNNLYSQAIKYIGTSYQFGGYTGGVDCSSYVSNVFRTFGFQFPRNTSSQNNSVGKIINLEDINEKQKLELIEQHPLALLYQQGHVMIYLGKEKEKHYIIHANATTMNVAINPLENSKNLKAIDKIVLIED